MTGPHAQRTPFSYPALAPLWADFAKLVETPSAADLYVFAHPLDVASAPRALIDDWRTRRRPVVVLSEEPFWIRSGAASRWPATGYSKPGSGRCQ